MIFTILKLLAMPYRDFLDRQDVLNFATEDIIRGDVIGTLKKSNFF